MAWFSWRRKKEKDDKPEDGVSPPVASEQLPPDVKPSSFKFLNYIRVLLILNKIPIKKLRAELKKLPWLDIFYVLGILVWVVMSFLFVRQLILVIIE